MGAERSPLGTWRNELGSHLRLCDAPGDGLSGSFASAVGATRKGRPVVGFHGRRQSDGSAIVGFVVRWPDSDSVGAWCGRYDPRDDRIRAEWLLVTDSDAANAWRATTMGCDEFVRDPAG